MFTGIEPSSLNLQAIKRFRYGLPDYTSLKQRPVEAFLAMNVLALNEFQMSKKFQNWTRKEVFEVQENT